jgi:hypothetical protein
MNTSSNSGAGDSSDGEAKSEKMPEKKERKLSINPFIAFNVPKRRGPNRRSSRVSGDFEQSEDTKSAPAPNGSSSTPSNHFDEHGLSLASDVAILYQAQRIIRETKAAVNSDLVDKTLGPNNRFRDNDLVSLVQLGVPHAYRRSVWLIASGVDLHVQIHHEQYKQISKLAKLKDCLHISPTVRDQIEKDLNRTIGLTIRRDKKSLLRKMRHVLLAHAIHKPLEGYCQALNFITMSFLVLGFSAEEAFWMLNYVTERLFPLSFDAHVTGQVADGEVLDYYFQSLFPEFSALLTRLNLNLSMLCGNVLIGTLFCDRMPYESVWCVWDRMFSGGAVEFFNAILKIIALVSSKINLNETDSCALIIQVHTIIRSIVDMPALLNLTVLKHKIGCAGLEFRRTTRRTAILRQPSKQLRLPSDSSSSHDSDSD